MANWVQVEKDLGITWRFKMECLMSFIELPFCEAFRVGTFIKSWEDDEE